MMKRVHAKNCHSTGLLHNVVLFEKVSSRAHLFVAVIQTEEGIGQHLQSAEGETGGSSHGGDRYSALGEGHDGCAES